mmetsp:Transcript_6658/g.16336  ORF Transcript_6658/g.16336 Transcript_6658/m.16336 type:complete len:225 (+) Transcript_6658:294-968(+)
MKRKEDRRTADVDKAREAVQHAAAVALAQTRPTPPNPTARAWASPRGPAPRKSSGRTASRSTTPGNGRVTAPQQAGGSGLVDEGSAVSGAGRPLCLDDLATTRGSVGGSDYSPLIRRLTDQVTSGSGVQTPCGDDRAGSADHDNLDDPFLLSSTRSARRKLQATMQALSSRSGSRQQRRPTTRPASAPSAKPASAFASLATSALKRNLIASSAVTAQTRHDALA